MVPSIIYTDMESLLEKIPTCDHNAEESFILKRKKHMACDYSLIRHGFFDNNIGKHDF